MPLDKAPVVPNENKKRGFRPFPFRYMVMWLVVVFPRLLGDTAVYLCKDATTFT